MKKNEIRRNILPLQDLKLNEFNSTRIPHSDLLKQVSVILRGVNVPEEHADITSKILVSASLRGVDTHGVGNAVRYSIAIEKGEYTIPQSIEIISETDTTSLLSCGNGLGFVAAYKGMEMSISKAKDFWNWYDYYQGWSPYRYGGLLSYDGTDSRYDRTGHDER